MTFEPTGYTLMNCADGRIFEDSGWTLADPQGETPSLVRAVYEKKEFGLRDDLDGFYKFADWLPIKRTLSNSSAPVTYKSKALADYLKLDNLYITFSGYSKTVNDANETFFVTNETPFHLSRLCVKFTYSMPEGEMLHEEFYEINCDIPAATTRQVSIRSFDRQHNFYYHLGKKPKRSATPFTVAYTLLSYDVKITVDTEQ